MNKFILVLIIFFISPTFVLAFSASIINNVSTSVSTGGKSSVKVYTEINGEVVEDFEKEASNGEEINYEAKLNINTEISSSTVSKTAFDTLEEVSFFRQILNYVFSFFKF